jgi:hypothetical protein
MSTRSWLSSLATTLVAGLLLAPSLSCAQLECADGTIERDGTCVAADTDPDDANCGPGTVLGDSGQCEPELPPTVCDELSTVPEVDPVTGNIVCVGVGGPGGCQANLPCPTAASGKVTVCGRLFDVETDEPLEAASPTFMPCDNGGADDGPCELSVTFYDALDFAGNPTGAVPIVPTEFTLDDCGRYVAKDMTRPQLGFLGIGVDDGTGGDYRLSGVAIPVSAGLTRNNMKTYVARESTNLLWSNADGVNLSPSFVDRGVFVSIFQYDGDPVAGVTVTDSNGARPNDDYYFSDTDPFTRTMVVPGGPTGANGTALLLNSSLVEHSGAGAEPDGCVWPSDLAASIPGVMFINPRNAETPAGAECP